MEEEEVHLTETVIMVGIMTEDVAVEDDPEAEVRSKSSGRRYINVE